VRFFGIDVHLEFCEVAVAEGGKVSHVGRIASTPEAIRSSRVVRRRGSGRLGRQRQRDGDREDPAGKQRRAGHRL